MVEEKDAKGTESSPVQDAQPVDSSTTEQEALAEATAQQAEQEKEVPFHEHPRWQEVQEEKRKLEAENAYFRGLMEARQQQVTPQDDPYKGMDAQTRVFYQDLDERNKKLFGSLLVDKEKQYESQIHALRATVAAVQEKLFRQEQTDVKPGSSEERDVAQLISMGVPPDKAAWAIMGPKRIKEAETKGSSKPKNNPITKAHANLETTTVTPGGISSKEKLDFRSDLEKRMNEAGI